jgi:tetratricopeptide (TPR) repeat protein
MPPDDAIPEALPVVEVDSAPYEAAARVLERAVQGGCQDANVFYLLALAYKRQGKTGEARAALRKIAKPDANVVLQMGLLSLQEQNLPQAEGELARAWEMDPGSYEICHNLLLTRLTLGQMAGCLALLPRAVELAPGPDERRFLQTLHALLLTCKSDNSDDPLDPTIVEPSANGAANLADLSGDDERRLLQVVRSLGQLDTVHLLLQALAAARPRSAAVQEAYVEAVLVKGKSLMDRSAWTEAERLLTPLVRQGGFGRSAQLALFNMLGCCACLTQDFDSGVRYFSAALKLSANDPRLHQNLALAHELNGQLAEADPHWNRYFDLLTTEAETTSSRDGFVPRIPVPSDLPNYVQTLAYESLNRLAGRYTEKEKWSSALGYVQRAAKLRPNDPDTMERLFHLYNHAKRPQDARRTLDQLRKARPQDPQLELYELDLIEVKSLNDIERLLTDIDRILKRHPGDARVEERAVNMVGNVIPLMGNLCDQLTEQMSKVIDQVKHLPNYQINWSAVREVMRDLLKEFQKLRRITGKCLPLVTNEEHRRIVRDLADHIDKKMDACRSMGA